MGARDRQEVTIPWTERERQQATSPWTEKERQQVTNPWGCTCNGGCTCVATIWCNAREKEPPRAVKSDGAGGPVHPSFRALPGRLKFTVRRHKFNKDILSAGKALTEWTRALCRRPRARCPQLRARQRKPPQPSTLNPQPSTFNPQPSTLDK